jgi:two-component system, LuxR family, sensor kinase FixL
LRRINQTLKVEVQRRKEIQLALVESREKYRALFRTFPIGIAITDDEGNIVEVNRALHRLTGQKNVAGIQQIGVAPLDLIRADGSPVERGHLARVRALHENRRVEDDEIGVRRPDGSYVWLSTTAAPIPVNGYGVVAAYTDVTERKEAIERDKRQQSEFARVARLSVMGEMASALAHELGQPLSSCVSYLDGAVLRLRSGSMAPAELVEALGLAKRQADQAGAIVKRVRNYVRRHRPECLVPGLRDPTSQRHRTPNSDARYPDRTRRSHRDRAGGIESLEECT